MDTEIVEKIFLVSLQIVVCVWLLFVANVIGKYHGDKPLGMQTIHSKIFEDVFAPSLIIVAIVYTITQSSINIFGPIPEVVAWTFTLVEFWAHGVLYFSIISIFGTRYLSIYHTTLLDSVSEVTLITLIKTFAFIGPMISAVVEYGLQTDMKDSGRYQLKAFGKTTVDSVVEKNMIATTGLTFLLAFILQIRLEIDHFVYQESFGIVSRIRNFLTQGPEVGPEIADNVTNHNVGYKINVTRIGMILASVTFALMLYVSLGKQYGKYTNPTLAALFSFVIPIIFLAKHPGMRKTAMDKLKSLIPD